MLIIAIICNFFLLSSSQLLETLNNDQLITNLTQFDYPTIGTKIIGGRKVKKGELPHQVVIYKSGFFGQYSFHCGGSLINDQWIITAAHCLTTDDRETFNPRKIIIAAGVTKLKEINNYRIDVKSIFVHPNYKNNANDEEFYDIGLIKTSQLVSKVKSDAKPISLPKTREESKYKRVTVSGFGLTRENGFFPSQDLRAATILIQNDNKCKKIYKRSYDKNSMICAGVDNGKNDTCQGDSGGPVSVKVANGQHILLGITSFGNGCGRRGTPGVYTKVSTYLNWINQVIQNN